MNYGKVLILKDFFAFISHTDRTEISVSKF